MSNDKQSRSEKAKILVATFVEFTKDNKLSCGMFFASGMLIAAKLYPAAVILTIVATANYAMDRVVDNGIKKATEHAFGMFTPEQQDKLRTMVADMDEMDEAVIQ
jgi:hypothetical protein